MSRLRDLNGLKFNKLTVIGRAKIITKRRDAFWQCRCDCGKEITVRSEHIRLGKTRSCGCQKKSLFRMQKIFDNNYFIKQSGCWEWKSYRDKYGYARMGNGKRTNEYSYTRFKGEIPENMYIYNTCRNPGCVNPAHLFLELSKTKGLD